MTQRDLVHAASDFIKDGGDLSAVLAGETAFLGRPISLREVSEVLTDLS